MSIHVRNPEELQKFIDQFDCFVCDCDGVFWRGNVPFPKVKEALLSLCRKNKQFFFATNNSTNSRKMYVEKFKKKVGFPVTEEQIFPSSYLLAQYLKSIDFRKKAYVCGMEGIKKELDEHGIRSCGYSEHFKFDFNEQEFVDNLVLDDEIGCIVASYDTKFCNYKIASTNRDKTFPMMRKDGKKLVIPGGGTYVAALAECFMHEPVVVGKPSTFGIELILKKHGFKKERVCFIGDRLDTDILMANMAGISSVLVLTGISTLDEVMDPNTEEKLKPKYIIEKFSDLLIDTKNNE